MTDPTLWVTILGLSIMYSGCYGTQRRARRRIRNKISRYSLHTHYLPPPTRTVAITILSLELGNVVDVHVSTLMYQFLPLRGSRNVLTCYPAIRSRLLVQKFFGMRCRGLTMLEQPIFTIVFANTCSMLRYFIGTVIGSDKTGL